MLLMELLLPVITLKGLLPLLAVIAAIFVITTKNAIISVFNLIVLYILVAFYLIYIGITYIGISYIIIYIGAIAILFLFIIMMIDVEVVEKRSNNYLPLLFLLLGGFLIVLKKILYSIGLIKVKRLSFEEKIYEKPILFNILNKPKSMKEESCLISLKDNNIVLQDKRSHLPWIGNNKICFEYNSENSLFSDLEMYKYISFEKNIDKEYRFDILNQDILNKERENNKFSDFFGLYYSVDDSSKYLDSLFDIDSGDSYLLIAPDWDLAANRITQISAIGDILYTVYHSYIYIMSVILLLGMVGAIILTADNSEEIKVINIIRNKKSSILYFSLLTTICYWFIFILNNLVYIFKFSFLFLFNNLFYFIKSYKQVKYQEGNAYFHVNCNKIRYDKNESFKWDKNYNLSNYNTIINKSIFIPSFSHILNPDVMISEGILGNLTYFALANIIVALLLLAVNSYFSLSVKYLDKGGGFECGFTSFVQTRERFNVIFYRVSLLFLVFDLEIILAFPYTVIYQKNQTISKNNVIAFLYILIVGFIYELKEGALNIVKKAHSNSSEIKN